MALPEQKPVERVHLRLEGPDSFAEDLGGFGEWVGPRLDELGKSRRNLRKPEGEDWCLRRLLIAWKRAGRLEWPCEVVSDHGLSGDEGCPDYLLTFGAAAHPLGVEVTEATSSEREAISQVGQAIQKKLDRAATGGYAAVPAWDLLIYLNSETSIFVEPDEILRRLAGAPWAAEVRQRNDGPRQIHIVFGNAVGLDVLGDTARLVSVETAYEHDLTRWLEDQAGLAEAGCAGQLDLPNIAEELRSLAGKDRRARDSHVNNLLVHLLTWQYQAAKKTRSWASSIRNARDEIEALVRQSPSLGTAEALSEAVAGNYPRARRIAATETGLSRELFPEACPFSLDQVLDPEFPPDLDRVRDSSESGGGHG